MLFRSVFFAFSKEQIEEQKKPGIKYRANSSMNMFYNIEKKDTIYLEIDKAIEEAQRIDKELHTKEQIILRELINYECFYICDFTDVVEPLQAYGYTVKDIQPIFIKYLQKYSVSHISLQNMKCVLNSCWNMESQ